MNKDVDWLLVTFICAFALGCAFVSVVLIFGSGFMVFELDYTDEQRQAANIKAQWISFFGFVSFCLSIALLFMCIRVADFISKVLGGKPPE